MPSAAVSLLARSVESGSEMLMFADVFATARALLPCRSVNEINGPASSAEALELLVEGGGPWRLVELE